MGRPAGAHAFPEPGSKPGLEWGLGWSSPVAAPSAFSPTIRGRDAELAVLGELARSCALGFGCGPAGRGSGWHGEEPPDRRGREDGAAACRFPVGIGAAEPSESVAELAPLLRALFDGPEPLLDRAGLSSLHAAPEQRYWRLQDLQSLLERAAMDGPLLIFLDDVQWVDSGTVAALRALPPRLASLPIGWVLAMRPDQGPGQLRSAVEYLADEGAERLVLEPLSEAAVAQVAQRRYAG